MAKTRVPPKQLGASLAVEVLRQAIAQDAPLEFIRTLRALPWRWQLRFLGAV